MIDLAEVERIEISRRATAIGGELEQLLNSHFSVTALTELSRDQRRECLNLLSGREALLDHSPQLQLPFMRRGNL